MEFVLTSRDNGVERVPMCGFPQHTLDRYVERLVQHGFDVAVAEVGEAGQRKVMHSYPESTKSDMSCVPMPENFQITDDHLGAGGLKTKFRNNIEAIKTLQLIERENRYATPTEQEVLSRYIGWGGMPQAFDSENSDWSKEYSELKGLLSAREYSDAQSSTLSSFYTSPKVIKGIYTAISNMGFTTGNILEPSCGVGNFFGLLPEEMSSSKLYGVELDSISGRIAKQLYPHADIQNVGYENSELLDNFFDVVIGNIPFGSYKVSDKRYNNLNYNIHDYFIAKSLDKVRADGIIAVITSSGTMDKQDPSVRRYIAQRAELLGAIRLPNNAFKENANTEVTADILFLQKRDSIDIMYSPYTTEWRISNKRSDFNNVKATVTYGTKRINGYEILEAALNMRDVKIYDTKQDADGRDIRVLNTTETTLARQKQDLIKQEFKDWIFKDMDRRTALVRKYNDKFNSIRPREYDGSHLVFDGMNPEITLRPHQLNAIAHAIYGNNTLFAHEVGAGKSFEMIASAMESKRLGLCSKSLFVVPNHLTEQMGADILRLYPSANILVTTQDDFTKDNRRKLCAKIATGDFDIVVIGHSQLIKIPISNERQEKYIRDQLEDVENGIRDLKTTKGERFQIKQLERTKRNLEARLKKLTESTVRDDVVTFEELGIDRLFIDEADMFKNAYFFTKMSNVAGVAQTEAQKSSDLMMKCRYMDELTDGRGTIFATGTPVSNSMTEVYTMMNYLQHDTLVKMGWQHFDAWAAHFGETITAMEIAPEGKGYRAKTRFAKFFNLPELISVFKECADIKTADVLNLPTPEAHYETVVAEPTEIQKSMVDALAERARKIHNKEVRPEEDNMLCVTNDGRKIGLDQRLINPLLPDEEGTKVNLCVNNVFKIWKDTADNRSTQLIFCDYSTPEGDGSFNVYEDIRE